MLYLGILCNFMPFFLIFELSKINYARTLILYQLSDVSFQYPSFLTVETCHLTLKITALFRLEKLFPFFNEFINILERNSQNR